MHVLENVFSLEKTVLLSSETGILLLRSCIIALAGTILASNQLCLVVQEVSFKQHIEDFRTMAPGWWLTVNGGKRFTLHDVLQQGTYNALIGEQAFFCSSKLGEQILRASAAHAHHQQV